MTGRWCGITSVAFSPDGEVLTGSYGQDRETLGRGDRVRDPHILGAYCEFLLGRFLARRSQSLDGKLNAGRQYRQALVGSRDRH